MKVTSLERRLRVLEAKMLSNPLVLQFEDGSSHTIYGPRNFMVTLLIEACAEEPKPEYEERLDLVRRCVRAKEPGGGRIVELMQAIQNEPDAQIELGHSETAAAPIPHI